MHGRRIDGFLIDMDGVLTVSWEPVPGAVEAIADLRRRGVPFRVMTNTTSRSCRGIAAALREAGFDIPDKHVLTASVACAAYLRSAHPGARVFVLGDAVAEDFAGVDLVGIREDPDVVVISGADPSFRFDNLNLVHRRVMGGAALVAMHRALTWMTKDGECLDAGAYLLALEATTGRSAVITGKPSPAFFRVGLESLGLPSGRTAMVGDDVETDVLAAQAVGIGGVLVRTGKFTDGRLAETSGIPDRVIDSVADLPALLA